MKRFSIYMFVLLSAIFLLSACSGQPAYYPEPANYAEEPVAGQESEITEYHAPATTPHVEATTPAPTHENATDLAPWQQLYAEILRYYQNKMMGSWAEDLLVEVGETLLGGLFTLHDFDKSGIPELIIWSFSQGAYFDVYSAYTYEGGEIVQLEIRDWFGGRGPSIFMPPSNRQGLIAMPSGSGYFRYNFISMDGNSLNLEVSVLELSTWDWEYSIYYIKGADVTPMEFTEKHYGRICTDCCYEERVSLGYVLTSEDEFDRIISEIFGNPNHSEGAWPHEINEANIQDIIFGWTEATEEYIEFITLPNGTRVDTRVDSIMAEAVIRHFDAIENGDLATFRAALSAGDAPDWYRNMAIIQRYFGDIVGVDAETVYNAIATGSSELLDEVEYALFESEHTIGSRNLGVFVAEIRLYLHEPEWWVLEATVADTESNEKIYHIHFGYCYDGGGPQIDITNAFGWLD